MDAAHSAATRPACIARVVDFYETLSPQSLGRLGDVYAPHARFKDPFNEVVGEAAIQAIFRTMFETLQAPRFVVTDVAGDARAACLLWEFHFCSPRIAGGTPQCIRGASWLAFDDQGRVKLHRDYWDAAEELYEKLPVVGSLMRWLKSRLAHQDGAAGVTTD